MGRVPVRLAVILGLVVAGPLPAQPPKVQITANGVRVGFTGGAGRARPCRIGAWNPVAIDVETGTEGLSKLDYEVVVETTDPDDTQTVYVEKRVPPLAPKDHVTLLAYARPGNMSSEITVRLRSRKDGQVLASGKPNRQDFTPLPPGLFNYVSLGGPLNGMKRALAPRTAAGQVVPGMAPGAAPDAEEVEPEENGNRRFGHADVVDQMPNSWFGYESADVVLLTSGSEKFVNDLNQDNDDQVAARIKALAEWVQRGGRLVVSVGHNHQPMAQLLAKLNLIDVKVQGQVPGVKRLADIERWSNALNQPFRGRPPADRPGEFPDLELARLVPGRGVRSLVVDRSAAGEAEGRPPVIVQGAAGLGRVIVIGFDVDQPPFTTWAGQRTFWDMVARQFEPAGMSQANPVQWQGFGAQSQELSGQMQDGLESFPEVPVISFGWVALFILIYILIVGPLDYFILKKVVKRLELTWITFPTVVILISAIAYFAAYALKGNDLRTNKTDVVDIDLHRPHVYGNTWFTLFSPRIQNYTVGVAPGLPGWRKQPVASAEEVSAEVSAMGRPDLSMSMGRGSQGLFRRAYDYAPEASGLLGVPIQVWSTKSFAASWHQPLGAGDLFESDLSFSKAQEGKVGGTLTSHLPVELQEVILLYRGNAYNLDRIVPDSPVRIDAKNVGVGQAGEVDLLSWFRTPFQGRNPVARSRPAFNPGQTAAVPFNSLIKSALFFGYSGDARTAQFRNSGLRHLDQRWRLDKENRDEAILVGRAVPPVGTTADGPAEAVNQGGLAASQLWLGALPGPENRPALAGTLSQETYVRVFLPVKTNK